MMIFGDILHQILLIGLFQNGIDRAVLVGVHRQIAVPLRGEVPHHQLGGGTILQLCQPDIVHCVRQTLDALADLPHACGILLKNAMQTLELWAVV